VGLFDSVKGMLGGKLPSSGDKILDAVMKLLQKGGGSLGGFGGLLSKLQSSGIADKVGSWVGTGKNDAVTPDEVEGALGADAVKEVAATAGVSQDEAKSGLANILPKLIDQVTPGGKLPTEQIGKLLKKVDFSKILGG